jgi:multiple sugar transport system permease protein
VIGSLWVLLALGAAALAVALGVIPFSPEAEVIDTALRWIGRFVLVYVLLGLTTLVVERVFSQRRAESILGWVFATPYLVHFLLFQAGAIIYSLYLSFFLTDLLSYSEFVGIENYTYLFTEEPLFMQAARVTLIYTLISVPLATIIALSIAVLLNQNLKFQGIFRTLFYMPALVTGVAVAITWIMVLHPDYGISALIFEFFGLRSPRWIWSEEWALPGIAMIALWGAGTNMLLYLAGLQSIPTQVQEAARIDGANSWQTFYRVTLPLLTPTVFFNVVLNMIGSFQVFTSSFVLTNGGPNNATLTMVLLIYRKAFQSFSFGYASAIAWVLFVVILVLTLIVFRTSNRWVYYEGGLRR